MTSPGTRPTFVTWAAAAGLCGALSGASVKIATAGWTLFGLIPPIVVFVIFMLLNVAFTGQMWRCYLRGLGLGPTPANMMVSTAVNMTLSAMLGVGLFEETATPQFLLGAGLMVVGLSLLVAG